MENEQTSETICQADRYDIGQVQEVIRRAQGELRQLQRQRAEIMKRMSTIKQTISSLANLCGYEVLSDEVLELINRKGSGQRRGITQACRMILLESDCALSTNNICDHLKQKMPELVARHKDPVASVTTILNRLMAYGEAHASVINGKRVWRWVADPETGPTLREEH